MLISPFLASNRVKAITLRKMKKAELQTKLEELKKGILIFTNVL